MSWLAVILIRRGVGAGLARVLAWLLPVLLAVALVAGAVIGFHRWLGGERAQAVAIDRRDVTIEAANRVIAAERAATANQGAADSAFANAQQELHDDIRDKGTSDPVGPGTAAVLDRMRAQQRAGRR